MLWLLLLLLYCYTWRAGKARRRILRCDHEGSLGRFRTYLVPTVYLTTFKHFMNLPHHCLGLSAICWLCDVGKGNAG